MERALLDPNLRFGARCRRIRYWTLSGWSARSVSWTRHEQTHVVAFDTRFVQRDAVYDQTSTGRRILAGDRVENFRSVHAAFAQGDDARLIGSNCCDDSSPSPWYFPTERNRRQEELLGTYSAGDMTMPSNTVSSVASTTERFASSIRSNCLRLHVQWTLGMSLWTGPQAATSSLLHRQWSGTHCCALECRWNRKSEFEKC